MTLSLDCFPLSRALQARYIRSRPRTTLCGNPTHAALILSQHKRNTVLRRPPSDPLLGTTQSRDACASGESYTCNSCTCEIDVPATQRRSAVSSVLHPHLSSTWAGVRCKEGRPVAVAFSIGWRNKCMIRKQRCTAWLGPCQVMSRFAHPCWLELLFQVAASQARPACLRRCPRAQFEAEMRARFLIPKARSPSGWAAAVPATHACRQAAAVSRLAALLCGTWHRGVGSKARRAIFLSVQGRYYVDT